MSLFDTQIMVDWSGGNDRGPSPKKDAIWACVVQSGDQKPPVYLRNRHVAESWLGDVLEKERAAGRRVCVGFDFPFGYPSGFGAALTGSRDPLALWDWFETRVEDAPTQNNRCDVASEINAMFEGVGPFWSNPYPLRDFPHLPRKDTRTVGAFAEKRQVERHAKGSFACWQLAGAGAVGSQVIMGLPVLARLRRRFGGQVAVWPFEDVDQPIVFVEIWPSLIAAEIAQQQGEDEIKDAAQVRVLARAVAELDRTNELGDLLALGQASHGEGWIFGVGAEEKLARAARGLVDA